MTMFVPVLGLFAGWLSAGTIARAEPIDEVAVTVREATRRGEELRARRDSICGAIVDVGFRSPSEYRRLRLELVRTEAEIMANAKELAVLKMVPGKTITSPVARELALVRLGGEVAAARAAADEAVRLLNEKDTLRSPTEKAEWTLKLFALTEEADYLTSKFTAALPHAGMPDDPDLGVPYTEARLLAADARLQGVRRTKTALRDQGEIDLLRRYENDERELQAKVDAGFEDLAHLQRSVRDRQERRRIFGP